LVLTPFNVCQTEMNIPKCKDKEFAQQRVIEWYAAKGFFYFDEEQMKIVRRQSAASLAADLGISRQTIYEWPKTISDFTIKTAKAQQEIIRANVTSVWNGVFIRAAKGEYKPAELFLSQFDPYFTPLGNASKVISSYSLANLLKMPNKRISKA
jgi:DNA-binding XRE family transcriptional regulator